MRTVLKKNAKTQLVSPISTDAVHRDLPATVLSRALHNEPNLVFMLPDEDTRRTTLPRFFRSAIHTCERYGEICTAGTGAALWIRPEHNLTIQQLVLCGMVAIPFHVERKTLRRYLKLATRLGTLRKRLVPEPHWYLMALGWEPASPAKAIGKILMEPVLSVAQRTGTPCYLETFNSGRLGFYEDYGFRIVGAGQVSESGPPFWAMTNGGAANVSGE
jgi:hypothetical protein